jgi:hypothetical protein
MSDTDESSECEFHGEDYMLLPYSDDKDSDESVHVAHNDFLWKVMDTYSGLREVFTGLFELQNSAQGVSDVDIFELFF